ncbi:MAG TPA: lipocalin family protein [Nevskiaceae bacterium]|nr:lipocalin family protein [Nevskiaceae bacterium]
MHRRSKFLAACGGLLLSLHAQASSLAGTYLLQSDRGTVVARLQVQASMLTGTLELPGGASIGLAGTAEGGEGRGLAMSGDGMGGFEAAVRGDELQLSIAETDASGNTRTYPLVLRRAGATVVAAAHTPRDASPRPSPSPRGGSGGGDGRLVGTWIHQTNIVSGSASFTSEKYFAFRPDGTYSYGNGDSAGGGSDWSYDGGSGEETEAGAWRTEGDQLDYKPNGGAWQRLGRYTFHNGSLVIYYAKGGRWIWGRR